MILRETNRLSGLVENVLGFARIADRAERYRFEMADSGAWLKEVVGRFRQSPSARDTTVVDSIPEGLPLLSIDGDALGQAVCNLLDNAVKYSPGCRSVWIEAAPDGEDVVIRVRDQGIGISPEDQERLFERFHRGRHPAARRVPGTGLGLSLVREVVSAHRGELTFTSRPGSGTTFSIRLKPPGAAAGGGTR